MEQIITLTVVLGVGFSILVFLAKQQFSDIKIGIKENNEKANNRIDKLEEKTGEDITNIKKELNDIKGDFATTFVLREDFFRAMNGVEDKVRNIDIKIDKILMLSSGRKD